jgi:hypothetical protein
MEFRYAPAEPQRNSSQSLLINPIVGALRFRDGAILDRYFVFSSRTPIGLLAAGPS